MPTSTVTKPTSEELRQALLKHGGSVTQTASAIGVHRVTVHKWMREYGIRPRVSYEEDLPSIVA